MTNSNGSRSPTSAQKRTAKRKAAKVDLRKRRQYECDQEGLYLRAVLRKGQGWQCVVDRKGFRANMKDLDPTEVAALKERIAAENGARKLPADPARDAAAAACRAAGGFMRARRTKGGGFVCVVDRRAVKEEFRGLGTGEKAFYAAQVREENAARRQAARDKAEGLCDGEYLRPVFKKGRHVGCVVDRVRYRRAVKAGRVDPDDQAAYDAKLAQEGQAKKAARLAEPHDCAKPPKQQTRCLDHAQECGWYWGKRKENDVFACRQLPL